MFVRRDFHIKKQLQLNMAAQEVHVDSATVNTHKAKAIEQLSMNRIKSREMEFIKIELFLIIAPKPEREKFFHELRAGLLDIFNDDKAKKTVEQKWSHSLKSNIMGLLHKIAVSFHLEPNIKEIFAKLYAECILKLMREDRLSRIEEKFVDTFVMETLRLNQPLQSLGAAHYDQIRVATEQLRASLAEKQMPKSLSNTQFLQYAVMSLLKMEIPHQKYIYNNLIHAPNPKYLLAFRRKGTFTNLTNEILLKLSKVDMVGFRYWSYFEYEDSDVYSKIRKASGWEAKSEIMKIILKSKMRLGLDKYLNLIHEKIKSYNTNTKQVDDSGVNELLSCVEICLEICEKKDPEEKNIQNALQRVGLELLLQQKIFESESRLKECMLKLVELYLKILTLSTKQSLKQSFIQKISQIICKTIKGYNEQKFKTEILAIVLRISQDLSSHERYFLLYYSMEYVCKEWKNPQDKVNPFFVGFVAEIAEQFGIAHEQENKEVRLSFFIILAVNFKENQYFESKKKLSMIPIDINQQISSNEAFQTLRNNGSFCESLKQHLRSVFHISELEKLEHWVILALIDEIVSFRIQVAKQNAFRDYENFFSVLVNFLEQVERIDSTGKLLTTVQNYFSRCIKTYMYDTSRLKYQDSGKQTCLELLNKNFSYIVEGSISANPILAEFCDLIMADYIQLYPEIAFSTRILTVLAQCLSFLYRKSGHEYESMAERLKGKYLVSNILIPTKSKEINAYMIKLMGVLYRIILHGHCLNENYLKVRVLYLIKQNTRTANITFGWKYLKHLITNFKDDREFIGKEVLLNNSCAWFISEEFFCRKIKQMKAERILLDKYLLPVHYGNCSPADLKKIFSTVEPQLEVEFLTAPPQQTESEIDGIIREMEKICLHIQSMYVREYRPRLEVIEQEESKLYEVVSRVKMIYIGRANATHILSRMLEVCRKYNNHNLLRYIFLKVAPLLYCVTDDILDSLAVTGETLHYVVRELNNVCRLYLQESHRGANRQDTFDVKTEYFDDSVKDFEKTQQSEVYRQLMDSLADSDGTIKRYMIIRLHSRRMYSLLKMYREILKYLNENFHVFVAKGIPLMQFAQIMRVNFLIDLNILELLPLDSICFCLTLHLQFVNILKASIEKGEVEYDEGFIDDFYINSVKIGLFHFQKRKTFYKEELMAKNHNIKSLKTKIIFFIQICDYLRNDDFHRFRKKKLPKKDEIFGRASDDEYMLSNIFNNTSRQRQISRNQLCSNREDRLNQTQFQESDVNAARYCLLYLISEQIDKIKAYSYMELEEIENPYSLAGKKRFISHEQILKIYEIFYHRNSVLIFNMVKMFGTRISNPEIVVDKISAVISNKPQYGFPEFLDVFIQQNKDNREKIKQINYWKPPNVQILFKYLSKEYESYPYLQLYVTKVLSRLNSNQILFYLPQIVQTLTLSTGQIIYDFLLEYAKKSALFAHQLIWICKVESKKQEEEKKVSKLPGVQQNLQKLRRLASNLIKDTIRQFSRTEKSFFKEVDTFFEEVTEVSGKLDPKWTFDQKKERIRQELLKIQVPKSAYLPTNPFFQVLGLKIESGTPMQSAAKCPFLLGFKCKKYIGPDKDFQMRKQVKSQNLLFDYGEEIQPMQLQQLPSRLPIGVSTVVGSKLGRQRLATLPEHDQGSVQSSSNGLRNLQLDERQIQLDISLGPQTSKKSKKVIGSAKQILESGKFAQPVDEVSVACIFKVKDDIRQDTLALQIIELFMEIFDKNELDLKLFPYKTISNRTGPGLDMGGIIEVVPKTASRDSIGKTNEESLYEYFLNNFGPEYNSVFQQARENFIKSQAAYSIVSYVLQIKDRHNGNIMINKEEGYIVHIDFGFIFDISPAGNLRFERADFKLTQEMIEIMGGKVDSEPFKLYMNLVIKGFLIARRYFQHVFNVVKLMYNSGLPCFLKDSMQNLESRFMLPLSEIEAAREMKEIILKAADHWTTNWYDKIQWIQQKIYH